ncbi:GNAT family N-acetyltransferase [Aurantibacter crassamenti]|uniref:GNAT family N-acetyltransferase n=1 Tax=Aurantibacter crassamenti TaxID=1837375 RepID=UPI0019398716|nr:GNAT family protein [Aurantibacter crassamenti]MBM1107529.1 GNAT family N-acetyltransferase [Aurantibacter crassamenti]
MSAWLKEVELIGEVVKLTPLKASHKQQLLAAASDGELWNLWYTWVPSKNDIDSFIEIALAQKENQTALPFVVIDLKSDKVIGTTRFMNADSENRRLEIGSTWYAASSQRTGINTECKYLLLQHAFEKLNCIAIEFRTNWFNYRSRNAILRLGAKQDGVLRNHRIDSNGILRDTVVFSIISMEWPVIKKSLKYEIDKH